MAVRLPIPLERQVADEDDEACSQGPLDRLVPSERISLETKEPIQQAQRRTLVPWYRWKLTACEMGAFSMLLGGQP
jgi:hypothetical protein